MKLYRSIGESELMKIIHHVPVRGMYDNAFDPQNTSDLNNILCCFVEEIRWKDNEHQFFLELDIPEDRIQFGTGTYFVPKDMGKNKIWTGRRGSTKVELKEAYLDSYTVQDIIKISGIFDQYANWFYNENVKPLADEYHIVIE